MLDVHACLQLYFTHADLHCICTSVQFAARFVPFFSRSPLMVIGSITSMLVFICAVYPVIICNGLWTKAGNWL